MNRALRIGFDEGRQGQRSKVASIATKYCTWVPMYGCERAYASGGMMPEAQRSWAALGRSRGSGSLCL